LECNGKTDATVLAGALCKGFFGMPYFLVV